MIEVPPQEKLESIATLVEHWMMLFRKVANRELKKGVGSDIVSSAIINFIAQTFIELILKYDQGFHDKMLSDLFKLIQKRYSDSKPEPERRIITLN